MHVRRYIRSLIDILIDALFLIERFVSIDAKCLGPWHRLNHNPHCSQRGGQRTWHNHHWHHMGFLVDLPPWVESLSDHILASVYSEFQLSPAYQSFLAEEAWPAADDAIFATPSLRYVTACWAWQRIIPKFKSAS